MDATGLPWRGPGPGRPQLPLPPGEMPPIVRGRLRKRWRYAGVFGDELILIAARVQVGPIGQTFWAVLDRESGELLETTKLRLPGARGQVWSEDASKLPWSVGGDGPVTTYLSAPGVEAKLRFEEGKWAETVCPTPEDNYVWTRKRAGIPIECELTIDGRKRSFTGRGIEDESAGYHPRRTVWSWSAGVGVAADGREVGWNLVSGVNDPPERSERAIWVDGEPYEPGPVSFDDALTAITFADGSVLAFEAEATRAKRENKGYIAYTYRQPFGGFSGSLDGIPLATGTGVMEFHDARW